MVKEKIKKGVQLNVTLTIGTGGRIRIPKMIREWFDWDKGQRVFVSADENQIVLKKIQKDEEKT